MGLHKHPDATRRSKVPSKLPAVKAVNGGSPEPFQAAGEKIPLKAGLG